MNAFIILGIFSSGYNIVPNGKNMYIPYNSAYSGGGPAPYSTPFPIYTYKTYKYTPGAYYTGKIVSTKKPKKPKNKDNI
tara:strand:+ start:109 stop:345 length:237 start_codon:yes stop_codon:yes gene_type:complete